MYCKSKRLLLSANVLINWSGILPLTQSSYHLALLLKSILWWRPQHAVKTSALVYCESVGVNRENHSYVHDTNVVFSELICSYSLWIAGHFSELYWVFTCETLYNHTFRNHSWKYIQWIFSLMYCVYIHICISEIKNMNFLPNCQFTKY